jgi:hypothetical protein
MVFDKGNLWKLWTLVILFDVWHCFPVVALLPTSLPGVQLTWFAALHFQIQPSSGIQFGESPLESDLLDEGASHSLDKILVVGFYRQSTSVFLRACVLLLFSNACQRGVNN